MKFGVVFHVDESVGLIHMNSKATTMPVNPTIENTDGGAILLAVHCALIAFGGGLFPLGSGIDEY